MNKLLKNVVSSDGRMGWEGARVDGAGVRCLTPIIHLIDSVH